MGGIRVATTLYHAEAVVTCDAAFSVHRPGVVVVEDGRIVAVGPPDAPASSEAGEIHLDGLLLPGFVDVHCHTPMTLFRGASEDVALERFLREILWPREGKLTPEDVFWGMALGCAEHLRAGTTTTCEMYVFEDAVADAVRQAGSRCVLTPGVIEAPPGWDFIGTWEERLQAVLAFHDREAAASDTIEVGIAAHAAYSLPLEALAEIATEGRKREALVHIHVAETRTEGRELERRHGKSVPALLDDVGLLDGRILAAHCVWLTEDDRRLFRELDVAVAHCPTANAKLASGIAPLADFLARGLRVGLGTDSPAANNDFDMWEEMRLAGLLARATTENPEAVSAAQALTLATRGGAVALGLSAIGCLEPGHAADMVHLRIDDPAFAPVVEDRDLVSHLVWAASSRLVEDVWVAGRRVVEAGRCVTVDEERARSEVQERAERLARG